MGLFHVQFLHVKHIRRTCLKIRNELGPTLPVLAQVTVCVCSGKPGAVQLFILKHRNSVIFKCVYKKV